MKDCGSCAYFVKWKDGGLCDFFDARTNTSHGKKCGYWKSIKYKRVKEAFNER